MSTSKTLKRPKVGIIAMCDLAKQLEDSGEYAKAAQAMGEWWQGVGVRPKMDDLLAGKKAAILSRVGALSGWLGSMQQVPGSQEKAKDLISESADLFKKIGFQQDWAEARSDLAVCYWREGAFDEARDFLYDTMADFQAIDPVMKGKILLRLVNVEISSHHYSAASAALKKAVPLIEEYGDDLLRGKLYFHRALINRRKAEETDNPELLVSVIEDYSRAGDYYQKAFHQSYSAMVENNLGYLYLSIQDFDRAHFHLDKSLEMYSKLKDKGRAALVYDNKARAFIAQGKLSEAELAALTSVKMLRRGGENATLAESLTTLGVILSRGGNLDKAIRTFEEAKETALKVGDLESAGNAVLTHIEELQSDLTPIDFRSLYLEADELLKNSPKISTINRLRKIVRKQFEISGSELEEPADSQKTAEVLNSADKSDSFFANGKGKLLINWEDFSLPETVRNFEGEIILKALNETNGRVTSAARLLGMSHQSLSLILHQRHKELQQYCIRRKLRTDSKVKAH